MTRIQRNLAAAVVIATCATGLLAGCTDDDESADTTEGTQTAPSDAGDASDGTAASGGTGEASFCDAYTEITVLMSGEPDPGALTSNIAIVEENVPEAIAEPTQVMTAAVEQVLASNGEDFSALEAPEFAAAQAEVDPYVFANCEFDGTVEVTGADFSFAGIPETIDAGRVAVLFTNEGEEAHEIALMRRNDGVEESFEELLALPEEEAMTKVTPVGGAFASSTGSSALLVGDLEPGDYIAICFVPTGTMVVDGAMTEGTGAPHFTHGMQQEFTVTG